MWQLYNSQFNEVQSSHSPKPWPSSTLKITTSCHHCRKNNCPIWFWSPLKVQTKYALLHLTQIKLFVDIKLKLTWCLMKTQHFPISLTSLNMIYPGNSEPHGSITIDTQYTHSHLLQLNDPPLSYTPPPSTHTLACTSHPHVLGEIFWILLLRYVVLNGHLLRYVVLSTGTCYDM